MKKFNYLLSAILVLSLVVFAGCGGGDDTPDKTAAEQQLDKLKAKTWKANAGSVTRDGSAEADFDAFTLTFTGSATGDTASGSYSTTNGADVFPGSTWAFDGTNSNILVRANGVKMNIQSVNDTNLKIQFTLNADGSGNRLLGLSGNWVFDLTAQ